MASIVPVKPRPGERSGKLKGEYREGTWQPDKPRVRWFGIALRDIALMAMSGLVLGAFAVWSIKLVLGTQ